jgi:flavin reductase (DIM6/NTAB) family NADH-FMN oxidoreductase RutF
MIKKLPQHIYTSKSIREMEHRYRTNFVNSLSGFKGLQLVGTMSESGISNLAPVSSIVHIGVNPPLIGMVLRPNTVPRQTLENIMSSKCWTLNNVLEEFYPQAHQCAARYDEHSSEFRETSLTEAYSSLKAPYVEQASIQIGLQLTEKIDIKANGTHMVIGEIVEVFMPQNIVENDGTIDIQKSGSLVVAGLNAYHKTSKLSRLSYPKVGQSLDIL